MKNLQRGVKLDELKPNKVLRGPIFPEPVQVIVTIPMGDAVKLVGKGVNTGKVYEPILTPEKLADLETTPDTQPFDGDAQRFRLAVEAMRLALAFEYDPYFSLSIARVDPLPHQLEAVYEYFLALPRIRFLLADDPGAGKTIMAGLLLKELKIRGLACRTLIITPANLSFQWQREMKDKFRENFEVIRSDVLRANYGSNPWQDKNQVITSVSWVSRIEDAKESLLRSHWDLIIVDEAHKMSAASRDKKTLARTGWFSISQSGSYIIPAPDQASASVVPDWKNGSLWRMRDLRPVSHSSPEQTLRHVPFPARRRESPALRSHLLGSTTNGGNDSNIRRRVSMAPAGRSTLHPTPPAPEVHFNPN